MKRLLTLLPVLVFCLLFAPAVLAETENVNYLDQNGQSQTVMATVVTAADSEWTGTAENPGWYVVPDGDTTIGSRVTVTGDVRLILRDNTTLTVIGGINVGEGNALTIYAQSTAEGTMGALTATADDSKYTKNAAIGGNEDESGGTVTICGGTVTATGITDDESDGYGAGIGGGGRRISTSAVTSGTVIIYGGHVIANGGSDAAGIGSGASGTSGTVTIYGGTVEANGGNGASAAIGGKVNISGGEVTAQGGYHGAGIGGEVTISGGTVTATGGDYGAGIGGGSYSNGGTVTITDGTVQANGGSGGAGIGGGYNGAGGEVNISGGTVTAIGGGGGAGIGGGNGGTGGTVNISGGDVTANGGNGGAGIGGGYWGAGGTVNISDGAVVKATGGDYGAGIGGGEQGDGGTVNISDGTVRAIGGGYGAGIGGGITSNGGEVKISGGTVTANGTNGGAGIGGGKGSSTGGNGGTVTISGGEVTAQGGNNAAGIGGGAGGSNGDAGTLTIDPDEETVEQITVKAGTDEGSATEVTGSPFKKSKDIAEIVRNSQWFQSKADYLVTSVTLDKEYLSLFVGDAYTLTATVLPEYAADKTVTWSTDELSVATVDFNGLVTGVSEGVAVITAYAGIDSGSCIVEVKPRIYTIQVDQTEVNFGTVTEGYTAAPEAQTVTITNTGNQTLTLNQPTATNFVVGALSATELQPGDKATFTVQPKEKLGKGTYQEKISITDNGHVTASVEARFTVQAVPLDDPDLETKLVTDNLKGVADTDFDTPEKVQAELSRILVQGSGFTAANATFYDVKLQYSLDGGANWIDATEDNFPKDGITVTLPYPDGTGKNTHNFRVVHMFTVTSTKLHTEAGKTETPAVTKTDKGLQVTLKGLSPVAVGWSKIETGGGTTTPAPTATPDDGIVYYTCPACGHHDWTATDEGYRCDTCGYLESLRQLSGYGNVKGVYEPKSGSAQAATAAVGSAIPQTGDDSAPALWAVLLAVSALGGVAVCRRKNKTNS